MQDLAIEIFSLSFPHQLTGISCCSKNKYFICCSLPCHYDCKTLFNPPVPAFFHQRLYDMPSDFPLHYLEIRLCCFQEKQFQMGEFITMNPFLTWSNVKKLTGFRVQFSSLSKVPDFLLLLGFRVCSCSKFSGGVYSAATLMAIPWLGDSFPVWGKEASVEWSADIFVIILEPGCCEKWGLGNLKIATVWHFKKAQLG